MGTTGFAWPVDAVAGVPSYTGRLAREGIAPLVAGATAARPFGGISGVRPGTANPIAATSTAWTGGLFGGIIDLESSNLSGPYSFMFNVATGGSVVASNAGNPRVDTLSVQISDPAEGDLTTNPLVTLVYNQGLAAASPVDPVTPVPRSFIVARLTFPAGSGTTPTVTWVAPYSVAAGGIGEVNTFAELGVYSYITAPRTGTLVRALDTTITYRYSGSAWKEWDSDWITWATAPTGITVGTGGSTLQQQRYKYIAGRAFFDCKYVLGTTAFAVGTGPVINLPFSLIRPTSRFFALQGSGGLFDSSAVTQVDARGRLNALVANQVLITSFVAGADASVTVSAPWTWAAADEVAVQFWGDPA